MTIELYTLADCPHCKDLTGLLASLEVPFDILPIDSTENITELRTNGMFISGAPVLRVGDTWLGPAQLFPDGYLAVEQVTGIIMEAGYV